jgi:hypothetical protein
LRGFAGTKGLLARLHCGGLIVVKDCSVRRIPVGFLHVVVVLSPLVAELFERGFFLTFTRYVFLLDRVLSRGEFESYSFRSGFECVVFFLFVSHENFFCCLYFFWGAVSLLKEVG